MVWWIALFSNVFAWYIFSGLLGAWFTFWSFGALFSRIVTAFDDLMYAKALKHRDLQSLAKEGAVVPQAKVEAHCRVVTFNDSRVGRTVIHCRAVLFSSTITFYAIDELQTKSDNRESVLSEHFLGKINLNCVEARNTKLSRYHRHEDTSSLVAPVKGKVVELVAKNGCPLFLPNLNLFQPMAPPAPPSSFLAALQADKATTAADQSGAASPDAASQKQSATKPKTRVSSSGRTVVTTLSVGREVEMDLLKSARAILIKLPSLRQNERWLNLCKNHVETKKWQQTLFHLPCADLLNVLMARMFAENTKTSFLDDLLLSKMSVRVQKASETVPPTLKGSHFYLDEFKLGTQLPTISNISEAVVNSTGDLFFDFDFLYSGGLKMEIRLDIVYRGLKVRELAFRLQLQELQGRMRFYAIPPPSRKCFLSCPQMPRMELQVEQKEVTRKGLLHFLMKLLPNLSTIVSNMVRDALFEDMIFPLMDDFPFPIIGDDATSSEDEEEDLGDTSGSATLNSIGRLER